MRSQALRSGALCLGACFNPCFARPVMSEPLLLEVFSDYV